MAFEYESKFILGGELDSLKLLGYTQILENISLNSVKKDLISIGVLNLQEKITLNIDSFYIPSNISKFDPNYFSSVIKSITKDNVDELVCMYQSALKREDLDFTPYLRCRTVNNLEYFLTLKDDKSREVEISLTNHFKDILNTSGFIEEEYRKKTKEQKKLYGKLDGFDIAVEFNTLVDFKNLQYLEVEVVCENESLRGKKLVNKIARKIGIYCPEKTIFEGGFKEERSYRKIGEIVNNK